MMNFFIFFTEYDQEGIIIVHEKSGFFTSFFWNISKISETIMIIKKIERNHGDLVYKNSIE